MEGQARFKGPDTQHKRTETYGVDAVSSKSDRFQYQLWLKLKQATKKKKEAQRLEVKSRATGARTGPMFSFFDVPHSTYARLW